MERLTEKSIGCFEYGLINADHTKPEFSDYDAFYNYSMAVKKLGEYEDAEEQGLLLRLPCPLGTKIYCIHNGFVEEGMFFEMSCFKFKDYYKKSWFLTREEAEQALKQMGE